MNWGILAIGFVFVLVGFFPRERVVSPVDVGKVVRPLMPTKVLINNKWVVEVQSWEESGDGDFIRLDGDIKNVRGGGLKLDAVLPSEFYDERGNKLYFVGSNRDDLPIITRDGTVIKGPDVRVELSGNIEDYFDDEGRLNIDLGGVEAVQERGAE